MIKYIRFLQCFETAQLQEEIVQLEKKYWKEHYNKKYYEGGWSTIQLRSVNGDVENNIAIHASALQKESPYKDTVLLEACPKIAAVIDFFKMEKTSVRLMKLNAGSEIKPHSDHDLSYEDGEVRIHIPIATNPDMAFYLEEEALQMLEGSCWYLNLSLQHRVTNAGDTDRVHLVIDGLVNDWVKAFFNQPEHERKEISDEKKMPVYSHADSLKIIEQLRLMNTAISIKMADDMEAALQQ